MTKLRAHTCSALRTRELSAALAPTLREADCLVLCGGLGAGKTHFSKGIAAGLGIADEVTSPTFNLLVVYDGPEARLPLYHFDLYRLDDEDQLEDIDYAATLEGDGVSLVEWGDKFPDYMPVDYVRVDIERDMACGSDDGRIITVEAFGARSEDLLAAWAELPGWERV